MATASLCDADPLTITEARFLLLLTSTPAPLSAASGPSQHGTELVLTFITQLQLWHIPLHALSEGSCWEVT